LKEFDGSNFSYPYKLEIYGINKDSKNLSGMEQTIWQTRSSIQSRNLKKKIRTTIKHAYPIKLTEQCMGCHQKEN